MNLYHRQEHRKPYPKKYMMIMMRKLSKEDCKNIRRDYYLGRYTQKELGILYNSNFSRIFAIIHRRRKMDKV